MEMKSTGNWPANDRVAALDRPMHWGVLANDPEPIAGPGLRLVSVGQPLFSMPTNRTWVSMAVSLSPGFTRDRSF